jgi:hypothetical protein
MTLMSFPKEVRYRTSAVRLSRLDPYERELELDSRKTRLKVLLTAAAGAWAVSFFGLWALWETLGLGR